MSGKKKSSRDAAPRPRGRPPKPANERGDRYNVYLSKPVAQFAKKLGNGSLSAGITIAIERVAGEGLSNASRAKRK